MCALMFSGSECQYLAIAVKRHGVVLFKVTASIKFRYTNIFPKCDAKIFITEFPIRTSFNLVNRIIIIIVVVIIIYLSCSWATC